MKNTIRTFLYCILNLHTILDYIPLSFRYFEYYDILENLNVLTILNVVKANICEEEFIFFLFMCIRKASNGIISRENA